MADRWWLGCERGRGGGGGASQRKGGGGGGVVSGMERGEPFSLLLFFQVLRMLAPSLDLALFCESSRISYLFRSETIRLIIVANPLLSRFLLLRFLLLLFRRRRLQPPPRCRKWLRKEEEEKRREFGWGKQISGRRKRGRREGRERRRMEERRVFAGFERKCVFAQMERMPPRTHSRFPEFSYE